MTEIISAPVKRPIRTRQVAATITAQLETQRILYADPLLPLRDVQTALGNISYGTLRRLLIDKKIRAWRPSPRGHYKIRLSELKKFLAQGDQQLGVQS